MEVEVLCSFLEGVDDSEFSLENVPFGMASRKGEKQKFAATRLGQWVINLKQVENCGLFNMKLFASLGRKVFQGQFLNEFMGLSKEHWKEVRVTIQQLFSVKSHLKDNEELKGKIINKLSQIVNHMPGKIGDFTDFSSSLPHAYNYGFIRGGQANSLNENWLYLPIGYHGRASSVVLSGTPVRRAWGQLKQADSQNPIFTKCKRMDYEVELGVFIGGTPNELGKPVKISEAYDRIFGFVLLNDWSYRDFMMWQFRPLGPFTCKNGITAISPWIITQQAIKGSQIKLEDQKPQPLPYLHEPYHKSFNIELSLLYKTPSMEKPDHLIKTNYKNMYWTFSQQLVHHSVTGCNMQVGDLIGSGTVSGSQKTEFGSMFELSWGGRDDVILSNGQKRRFMQDGDSATITGRAISNGKVIGFGECQGTILPALDQSEYY